MGVWNSTGLGLWVGGPDLLVHVSIECYMDDVKAKG